MKKITLLAASILFYLNSFAQSLAGRGRISDFDDDYNDDNTLTLYLLCIVGGIIWFIVKCIRATRDK